MKWVRFVASVAGLIFLSGVAHIIMRALQDLGVGNAYLTYFLAGMVARDWGRYCREA